MDILTIRAKNPSGLQVKHRAIVSVSALEELRDMIWKALSD